MDRMQEAIEAGEEFQALFESYETYTLWAIVGIFVVAEALFWARKYRGVSRNPTVAGNMSFVVPLLAAGLAFAMVFGQGGMVTYAQARAGVAHLAR